MLARRQKQHPDWLDTGHSLSQHVCGISLLCLLDAARQRAERGLSEGCRRCLAIYRSCAVTYLGNF